MKKNEERDRVIESGRNRETDSIGRRAKEIIRMEGSGIWIRGRESRQGKKKRKKTKFMWALSVNLTRNDDLLS
jgi:hypothetical protein